MCLTDQSPSRYGQSVTWNGTIKDEWCLGGPYIPKRSFRAALQGMTPALATTGALWYTCLKPSPGLPDLNAFGWEQKNECAGNRRTPHIQRKSHHFLFSFPLLSPGCFHALPTSLPLCLAFPLSRNPVILASSMFVHFLWIQGDQVFSVYRVRFLRAFQNMGLPGNMGACGCS